MNAPPSMQSTPIRVLVADDHPVVRIGVTNVLSAHGRFLVVAEAEDGTDAFKQTLDLAPDILLLDVQMPSSSGLSTLRHIAGAAAHTRVVLLTGSLPPGQAQEAFRAGARGLVLKSALVDQIAAALFAVMEGAFWVSGRRFNSLEEVMGEFQIENEPEAPVNWNLTRRELEVVGLIVKGLSNRDIARQFNLSEETVKRHLSNIFEKLGISTRLELAIFAIAKNLAPDTSAPAKPVLPSFPSRSSNGNRA